jgi:hypothetical protein
MMRRAESQMFHAVVPGLERDIAEFEERADALRNLLLQPERPASARTASPRKRSRKSRGKKKR